MDVCAKQFVSETFFSLHVCMNLSGLMTLIAQLLSLIKVRSFLVLSALLLTLNSSS